MKHDYKGFLARLLWTCLFLAVLAGSAVAAPYGTVPTDVPDGASSGYISPEPDVYYGTRGDTTTGAAPRSTAADYPRYRNLNNRLAIWVITQQHTYFGGFVLALPIFCLIIEVMGLMTRDRTAAARYDRLARDFLRISLIAFSISSILGVTLVLAFIALYPTCFRYFSGVFEAIVWIYRMLC